MNALQRLWAAISEEPRTTPATPKPALPANASEVVPAPHEAAVKVSLAKEGMPKFARTYLTQLDNRATAEVTFYYSEYFGRTTRHATLTQPNGKYVLFEIDAIADKILDPALVPLVQEAVAIIKRLDAEFCRSRPTEFTDEKGVRWIRADAVPALTAA